MLKQYDNQLENLCQSINVINQPNTTTKLANHDQELFDALVGQPLLRLAYQNDANFDVSFDYRATSLIRKLFEYYDTDETLFVISDREHENVYQVCNVHHKLILSYQKHISTNDLSNIQLYVKQHPIITNVVVYIAGTQFITGIVIDDKFYVSIRSYIESLQCRCILINDAVQEMFISDRNYQMFDYVIGTAHSLIPKFNLGILITNKSLDHHTNIGYHDMSAGLQYVKCLGLLLKYRDLIKGIGYTIKQHIQNVSKADVFANTIPWIVCFKIDCQRFVSLKDQCATEIHNSEIHFNTVDNMHIIRIRSTGYIYNRSKFESILQKITAIY